MAGLETTEEMFDLRMSEGARELFEKVKAFVRDEVDRHAIKPLEVLERYQRRMASMRIRTFGPGRLRNRIEKDVGRRGGARQSERGCDPKRQRARNGQRRPP